VPAGATAGPVSVTTPLGTAISPDDFVVLGKEPFINSFSPLSGKPGDVITLTGVNFSDALAVLFNGLNASSFSVTSPTQIRATVPTAAAADRSASPMRSRRCQCRHVHVTTAPMISVFSPLGGAPGTAVVINGLNFLGATSVSFGGTATTSFAVTAATQLQAVVPAGATNGPVTITTPQGTGSSVDNFLATTGPIITDVSVTIATPGTTIVIDGQNLASTISVTFNGVAAKFGVTAPTQINAIVPAAATSGPLTVATTGGSAVAVDPFLIQTGKPLITSFSPEAGPSRTPVIIEGLDLAKATA